MKFILRIMGVVAGGFILYLAVGSGEKSWLRLAPVADSAYVSNGSRASWAQGSDGSWVQVRDTPANEQNRSNDEKARKRQGVANCWQEQARKSLEPVVARNVATVCEGMEATFMQTYAEKP